MIRIMIDIILGHIDIIHIEIDIKIKVVIYHIKKKQVKDLCMIVILANIRDHKIK